ncbi:MAG: hypothetical protein QOC95_1283 [Thermoleophilaceae bacterium]|nr:hypothetical protein [Thermoleophilaceae bacterium]
MSRKLLCAAFAAVLSAVVVIAFALPAGAAQRTIRVRVAGTGAIITVTVDAACGPMDQVPGLPGTPIEDLTPPGVCGGGTTPAAPTAPPAAPTTPAQPTTPAPNPQPGSGSGGNNGPKPSNGNPSSNPGRAQHHSGSRHHADPNASSNPLAQGDGSGNGKNKKKKSRHSNGVPTPSNPTFFDALPGPSAVAGVPNFVISKFKVPIFLLPIYQAAGIQYGVRWEVLAAINEIETDYGRNLNVSSAGAVGWMQFLPSTWKQWGVDVNRDG